ncbi:hypothetical protein [Pantoea cypripedii]|nr:hypothetical protein [Pantoea cypripedii]
MMNRALFLETQAKNGEGENNDWLRDPVIGGLFNELMKNNDMRCFLEQQTELEITPDAGDTLASMVTCKSGLLTFEDDIKLGGVLVKLLRKSEALLMNSPPTETMEAPETPLRANLPDVPDLLEQREKLKEFRQLGENRKFLVVDRERLPEKASELGKQVWTPYTPALGGQLRHCRLCA